MAFGMIGKPLKTLALSAALALTVPAWVAAESLGDTLVATYRHSALLDQNRAVLRAADEDVASAMAALRPVIQWVASHTYTNTEGYETLSTSLQFQASVTLYDFGRSQIAIDAAKETVLATREALVSVEQDILLAGVQAFLNVRSAGEQVELQQNSLNVLAREQRAAQDRFDVGEITSTDVAQANAQLAATRATLASAEGSLQVARELYKAATGKMPSNLSAPPPLPKLPASLGAAQAVAQKTHPAIRQAQRQVAAAELGVAAAQAQRNPTITGSAGVGASRTPNNSIFSNGGRTTTGSAQVGISANQTLYSGGALSAALRKSMANRDAGRAALLNTARQVDQAVATSWANIDVARAQIGAINEQISAAQQAYDGVREEATLGARTTLDVLNAEQSLLEARASKISAEADLQLAHYQLLSSMGLLTVEHLKLGIPTYDPSAYYSAVRDAPYTSRQGESLDRVLRAIGKN